MTPIERERLKDRVAGLLHYVPRSEWGVIALLTTDVERLLRYVAALEEELKHD